MARARSGFWTSGGTSEHENLLMHPLEVREAAWSLYSQGLPDRAVAERLRLARETVREWRRAPTPNRRRDCPRCDDAPLEPLAYAYLLGLYLGDGHLSLHRRGVYHLRVTLDACYGDIIAEAARAMAHRGSGSPDRPPTCAGMHRRGFLLEALALPVPPARPRSQTHVDAIKLEAFQFDILRSEAPALLRGLIHSDGCRVLNRVAGRVYPRYHFSNRSDDIRSIFCSACDVVGVRWTQSSFKEISVARATDVAKLDQFVGPKR